MMVKFISARVFLCILFLVSACVQADIDVYEFKDEAQHAQYQQLAKELRCPKCQNQNIADSNAPIAKDMRHQVYQMTLEGKSSSEIVAFMVDRFGEFVVYTPRFDFSTWLLWLGPAVIGILGVLVVVLMARRKVESSDSILSAEESEKLKKILAEDETIS